MVQSMHHGVAPASLHINEPSKHIDWARSGIELLSKARQWPVRPEVNRPRRAAVSAFGIGGTNSHMILEQHVEREGDRTEDVSGKPSVSIKSHIQAYSFPWILSGTGEASMRAQAQALLEAEAPWNQDPANVAFSLATTRSAHRSRAMVTLARGVDPRTALEALAQGRSHPDVVTGGAENESTNTRKARLAFLFSGQGGQKPSLGVLKELGACFPVFSQTFRDVCEEIDQHLAHPLSATLMNVEGSKNSDLLSRTDCSQAMLFAFEVALFRLLESFNVRPDFVTGHSLGEIAAATCAGVLSIREAAVIVTARGRLMATLPTDNGAMVSISATEKEVSDELSRHQDETLERTAVIAAVNSHNSVVISGNTEAVMGVAEKFAGMGRRVARLRHINHGFHSPLMDPILPDFERVMRNDVFGSIEGRQNSKMPVISSVTGRSADAAQLRSPRHWVRHLRDPVCFAAAVNELQHEGSSVFVEVGPSTALSTHVPGAVATDQVSQILVTLGRLWTRGIEVDWQAVFKGRSVRVVDLPVYSFQRRRYWLNAPNPRSKFKITKDIGVLGHGVLLNAAPIPETSKIVCFGHLSVATHPWLGDHVIGGQAIFPATGVAELALRAGYECSGTRRDPTGGDLTGDIVMLEELAIVTPLALSLAEEQGVQIQVIVGQPYERGSRSVDIYSRPNGAASQHQWTRHATGSLMLKPDGDTWSNSARTKSQRTANGDNRQLLDISKAYAALADLGLSYGPSFRCVRAIWRSRDDGLGPNTKPNELWAHIELSSDLHQLDSQNFMLHPALLDAALHASLLAEPEMTTGVIRLPFLLRGVQIFPTGSAGPILAHVRKTDEDRLRLTLTNMSTGALVAEISEVLTRAWHPPVAEPAAGKLYRLEWTETAQTGAEEPLREIDEIFRSQSVPNARAAIDGTAVKSRVHNAVTEVLRVIHRWIAEKAYTGGRLIIVTEEASIDDSPDVAAAAVWGFVRSAQAEFGEDRIVLVDLDGSVKSEAKLLRALASREGVLAVRAGLVMVPRLGKALSAPSLAPVSPGTSTSTLDASGTVLITGGTGGLGALLGRHIAHTYEARHMLLVSRSGMQAPGARQLYKDLSANATVRIEECDCSDRTQLAAMLASNAARGHPPISAVIHCAGVVDDAVLSSQSPQRVSAVLRPKVDAAWNLHDLVPDTVSSFILFSSAVGILGNEGQAGYTAGNCFLDALARYRVARGLPALSLAWGPWRNEAGSK